MNIALTQQTVTHSQSRHRQSTHRQSTHRQSTHHQSIHHQSAYRPRLKHIMIISDEVELTEKLQIELAEEGYQVSVIHDGLRGLTTALRIMPDLIVIGWSPARISGCALCDRLRTNRFNQPIILLTSENNTEDRIAGLNAGASDCLSAPFSQPELVARIKSRLTRQIVDKVKQPILQCADIVLNRNTREVFRDGQLIRLTAKEFNLLEYLMDHYFQVLTRTQILENVWGYEYMGNSNIIEVYIRYLRRKLQDTENNRLIHTVRSVGYIFREV